MRNTRAGNVGLGRSRGFALKQCQAKSLDIRQCLRMCRGPACRSWRSRGLRKRALCLRENHNLFSVFLAVKWGLLFEDNPRLLQIAEEFSVKAFIAKLVVKAFDVPVFPRAPRLDVERLDLLGLQPVLDAVGDKLGPVVAAQVFGHSIAGLWRFHHRYDVDGPDRPRRMNGQALPGVFVNQGEDAKAASILGLVSHEVPAPNLAWPLRLLSLCSRNPYPLHPSLFLAHFDSFFSSNPRHSFHIDREPIPAHQRRDASISVARMLRAQLQHFLANAPALKARSPAPIVA